MPQDHDAIWADTTDGGLLRQLFGQFPTLHDALVLGIEFERSSDRMEMVLDYREEETGLADTPLSVRIRLFWQGVRLADLKIDGPEIGAIEFHRHGEDLVTEFRPTGGVEGRIVSETVEALLVQADPVRERPEKVQLRFEGSRVS
jgi:hypothetical protein